MILSNRQHYNVIQTKQHFPPYSVLLLPLLLYVLFSLSRICVARACVCGEFLSANALFLSPSVVLSSDKLLLRARINRILARRIIRVVHCRVIFTLFLYAGRISTATSAAGTCLQFSERPHEIVFQFRSFLLLSVHTRSSMRRALVVLP